LAEFCHWYGGRRSRPRMLLEETREERGDDTDADDIALSPIARPPETEGWLDRLTITLSAAEGEFLHQLMAAAQPDSLLGQIMMDDRALGQFLALRENATFDELADLPFVAHLADRRLRKIVRFAKLFWDLLLGAHVRYNCLLQERFGEEALRRDYARQWSDWRHQMRAFPWNEWDTGMMWEIVVGNGGQPSAGRRRMSSSDFRSSFQAGRCGLQKSSRPFCVLMGWKTGRRRNKLKPAYSLGETPLLPPLYEFL
jgi:hypothetical protein